MSTPSTKVVALRAARMFDGTGGPVTENAVVVVQGTHILAAGRASEVAVPADAEMIELPGHTLMPGLIDAHTHMSQAGERRIFDTAPEEPEIRLLKAARNMRNDLRAGVTTVRLVGTPDFSDIAMRTAIEAGDVPGPRIITATRAIHATNGHGYAGGFDGVEEIRKAVRLNLRRGADLIKFMATGSVDRPGGHFLPEYSREEFATIINEAHRYGRKACTHCIQPPEIKMCVELGVDFIEHGHMMDDDCIDLMKRRGTWLVGTLAIVLDEDIFAADLAVNPAFRDIEWLPRRAMAAENTRKAFAAGLHYACGTDAMHGGMPYEVRAHVEIGIDPHDALMAATANAARACCLDDRIGTLKAGMEADILAVDGDPLTDIMALERPVLIMKAGRRYDHLIRD
jgi:imidazolonepropionase-like amidohydrolase